MPIFDVPPLIQDGWGPSTVVPEDDDNRYDLFTNINYFPPARIGKACDFTQGTQDRIKQMQARELATGRKNYWMPTQPLIEADGYALVDTKHAAKKKSQSNFRRGPGGFMQSRAFQQQQLKQGAHQDGFLGQTKKKGKGAGDLNKGKGGGKGIPRGKGGKGFGGQTKGGGKGRGKKGKGGFFNRSMPTFRDWSIEVKNDWEMVSELTLSSFVKMAVDSRQVEEDTEFRINKLSSSMGRQLVDKV